MGIILSERAHTSESVELTALLITEHRAKLCYAERQVLIRAWLASIDLAVVRAVHWLEHVLFLWLRRMDWLESVLAVMGVVAGCDIEVL